jgi:hypothetical protein
MSFPYQTKWRQFRQKINCADKYAAFPFLKLCEYHPKVDLLSAEVVTGHNISWSKMEKGLFGTGRRRGVKGR